MKAFINDYKEPVFFKIETEEIEKDPATEFFIRKEEPHFKTKYVRLFLILKNKVMDKLKIPDKVNIHRISKNVIIETKVFKNKKVIRVVSEIESKYLRKIK